MRNHVLPAALAAILLGAGGAAMAQAAPAQTTTRTTTTTTTTSVSTSVDALDETAIRSDITGAGYREVKGLTFKDGVWQAKARGGNDKWSHIKIGPTTGKVYEANAPSRLNENEIKAKLTAQGYRNIDGVKFDRGLWKAGARNPDGKKVDLLADPNDGSVVAVNQG
ncbi:MAG: PepSY domain-containing protein [Rhodanobacter sp.]|nr:MAG: PepSY domain-containing protein [Rhodanobacter sp.]TAM11098.1 MAG: PepSY domain-containing protein [Rhodanobacter sp.]TAM35824.1 MAG: PepSY domain-containing protein [Rhodanobacter sp.]